jgi:hypothetical protein
LAVGTTYQIDFDYDARAGNGLDGAIPSLTVTIGDLGAVFVDPQVTVVDPKGVHVTAWHHGQFTFTADSNPMTLTFSSETPNNADGTLLLGNVALSWASPLETQSEDNFAGGFNSYIPWRWDVPGNNPNDTEDPTHFAFSSNSLEIAAQSGTLYAANNNAHNIPNLLILGQPDYWFVETAVSTDWSMASLDRYVQAGLVFLTDADNYFIFYNNRDTADSPSVQVSSTFELTGNPGFGGISSNPWSPTPDYVMLRAQGTPTDVSFLFNRTGTWQLANGGRVSSTNLPDVYAFMSSLVGKRVGLETDTGGGFNLAPFDFGYFKTNLLLSQ